jgi:endonuclease G
MASMSIRTIGGVHSDKELSESLVRAIERLQRDDRPRFASPRQRAHREMVIAAHSEDAPPDRRLERILQGNDLTDISYLARGLQRARSVARIVVRRGEVPVAFGTGFMVAPGVLLTNHHVLPQIDLVGGSRVQFGYETNLKGGDPDPEEFGLLTNPLPILNKELDLALVGVESRSRNGAPLANYGWLRLNPNPGKAFIGEYLTIIQHPGGGRKQVCVRENKLLKMNPNSPFLWYQTDTVGGSSGSPVFSDSWEVVALHHSGVPRIRQVNGVDRWLTRDGKVWTEDMGDDAIDWIANEGVRVSSICNFLKRQDGAHPLALAVLGAPTFEAETSPAREHLPDTSIHALVSLPELVSQASWPVRITFGSPTSRERSPSPPAMSMATADFGSTDVFEKVEIDTSNYHKRNGFQTDFLGDSLIVPLPKITSKAPDAPLKLSRGATELRYWNYSVVMNQARGLAYFSAANIRPKFKDSTGTGDFERDQRVDDIDENAQIGREFYKKQSTFEADRTKNPFDQGHLTRREDLSWGKTFKIAKRNSDDSFHYTNCAPQHWQFNQNKKVSGIWYRLEVAATNQLSVGEDVCVINGPIFDGPQSAIGDDGIPELQLDRPRKKDPKFGGFRIPKQFFKVIAYNDDGQLRVKAFIVSQEALLQTIEALHPEEAIGLTDAEISLYQVSIKDVQLLTGLKFGFPAAALVPLGEAASSVRLRRIDHLSDVDFT